jgi:hypothetical protein
MPRYSRELRKRYDNGELISDVDFIRLVLDKANEESDKSLGERLAYRGIKALSDLEKSTSSSGQYFDITEIRRRAKLQNNQSPTSGLWVWDDAHGCGIIEKKPRERKYRVKAEFLSAVVQVIK